MLLKFGQLIKEMCIIMYKKVHLSPFMQLRHIGGVEVDTLIHNFMLWLLYPQEMAPVPNKQETEWAPEPVWMVSEEQEICCPSQDWNPGQSSL